MKLSRIGIRRVLSLLAAAGLLVAAGPGPGPATATSGTSRDLAIGFVLDRGRIEKIDLPGNGDGTTLFRITNGGRIVGKAPNPDGVGYYGFVGDRSGRFHRIDYPGATTTYAQGINERGWIVGGASPGPTVLDPGATGYLLVGGKFTRIAYPAAVYTQAVGINNRGQVVGEYRDQAGVSHGFRWQHGRFVSFDGPRGTDAAISDINDRGDMVGAYAVPADNELGVRYRGFLLREGKYTTFAAPGRPFATFPFDINNRGQVSGFSYRDTDLTELHGFLLRNGADGPVRQIDVPRAPNTQVVGLDDRGRLIGVYQNPNVAPGAQRTLASRPTVEALQAWVAKASRASISRDIVSSPAPWASASTMSRVADGMPAATW